MYRTMHLRAGLAALATTMMGIGLARFSYAPIAAALVDREILTSADVTRIAAVMLAAYGFGAFTAHALSTRFGDRLPIRAALIGCVIVLGGEGALTAPWMIAFSRAILSALGAVLIVLGPTAAMRSVRPEARAGISAIAFSGIGLGAIGSGWIVAALAGRGDGIEISLAVATLGIITATLGWGPWLHHDRAAAPEGASKSRGGIGSAGVVLGIAWAADACGYIPHATYLSDYISSELGRGVAASGFYWSAFGFGATAGPFVTAFLYRRTGGKAALMIAFVVKGAMVALPAVATSPAALVLSAVIVGTLTSGMAALMTLTLAERVEAGALSRVWGRLTALSAVAQGTWAFAFAFAYSQFDAYRPLFLLAAGVLMIAATVLVLLPPPDRR